MELREIEMKLREMKMELRTFEPSEPSYFSSQFQEDSIFSLLFAIFTAFDATHQVINNNKMNLKYFILISQLVSKELKKLIEVSLK